MANNDSSELSSKELIKFKDLTKKRGSIKCRLTCFKKYLSSFEGKVLTVPQYREIKLRILGTQNLFNDFNRVQNEIEGLAVDHELEKQLEERENFEKEYYNTLANAQCLINDEEVPCSSNKSAPSVNFKLPTIPIPEFDGSYEHWLEFRDTYLSLVHNSREITDIQKYHYLKSCLKGTAKSVIDSLEISASNYRIAWELLLTRFDNVKLLAHSHIKSIFSMPALSKESPAQLRKLIDNVLRNLRALKALGEPTDSWDTLIIYIMVSKLDSVTEREWEQHKHTLNPASADSRLKLDDLLQFLRSRADILETLIVSHSKVSSFTQSNDFKKPYNSSNTQKVHCNLVSDKMTEKSKIKKGKKMFCLMCNLEHPLYSCQQFLDLSAHQRMDFVRDKRLCINCMRPGHSVDKCVFGPCRKCDKKHNSLICDAIHNQTSNTRTVSLFTTGEKPNDYVTATSDSDTAQTQDAIQVHTACTDGALTSASQPVLLSTALVQVRDITGDYHEVRAILDSGSERCFVTRSLCDKLNSQIIQSTHQIKGVGNSVTQCSQSCAIELKSLNDTFETRINCLVLPRITSKLPSVTINIDKFEIPDHITLADPYFFQSQPIDLLIGADLFWELISEGKMSLTNGPYLQNTKLGWVVSGAIYSSALSGDNICCNFTQTIDNVPLDILLSKFWEIEDLPPKSTDLRSEDEQACEKHFLETTKRAADGRFIVQMPLKQSPNTLGNTLIQAQRRFCALEKRLDRNPEYKEMYKDFIHEYIDLGHMSHIESYGHPHYFMPHHGVFREHATTTKLRTVFDASMASSTGVSLNDLQLVGPAIQGDLLSILLRFREHRYVACADVEKMYRQVLVDQTQRDLQLILWRDNPTEPVKIYQLNTVTYGTASAPFLSCRCLKQLAQQCDDSEVARTINEDFYVDDLICGSSSIASLNKICEGTTRVLKSGCFPLRKWVFNFEHENPNYSQNISRELSLGEYVHNKTLGLGWFNKSDELHFHTQINMETNPVTKRTILSKAAQIYDPLGLLSPFITIAKSLLQKCWLLKLDWDEPVPQDVARVWDRFINDCLCILNNIRIPRYVMCVDPLCIELHIFTDASQLAYGACAYIRTIDLSQNVTMRLLCSKAKVAPTKAMTIPRLELCGALVGARLYAKINDSLRSKWSNVIFWTDSTIVIGWLGMPTNVLKPFVQHRTSEIHELTKLNPWRHVSGKDNPADLVSRGCNLDALSNSSLWWEGPGYLRDPNFRVPCVDSTITASELRRVRLLNSFGQRGRPSANPSSVHYHVISSQ